VDVVREKKGPEECRGKVSGRYKGGKGGEMNELILTNSSTKTMTSLEISELVESQHGNVCISIERLAKRGAIQLPPMQKVENKQSTSPNNKVNVYLFSGDQGKRDSIVVVAQLSPEFTARLVDRWQELEAQAATNPFKIPATYAEALRLAADLDEKNTALQKQIELDRPKTIFADAVTVSHTTILVGELAKLLKQNGIEIGQNRLFDRLRNDGWLIKRKGSDWNMPTQKSMELGLFEIKERTVNDPNGAVRITKTTKVTGKGQVFFVNLFLRERDGEVVEIPQSTNAGDIVGAPTDIAPIN